MNPKVVRLLELAKTPKGIAEARARAKEHLSSFPKDGCGAMLSSLLQLAGIGVEFQVGAEELADVLKARGWQRVAVLHQQPGDVGVTADLNRNRRADHIYLVTAVQGPDAMQVVDNQAIRPHIRYASGKNKTATAYFLRAPE